MPEQLAVPVVAVVGATATGKSDLAVALAHRLGGEVVNADAMQLYRGMDIGTAKLSPAQRHGVPHHLLDVLDVEEEASLAAYQRDAVCAVRNIAGRGGTPILAGGSGLYIRAVLDDLQIPPTDPAVRRELEGALADHGPAAMHRRLAEQDPAAAAAILPSNGRRIVRALEVIRLTGRPFTATLPAPRYRWTTVQVGLRLEDTSHERRLATRVDRMWADGLVEETRALLDQGLCRGRTAPRALGYAQVLALLGGTLDDEAARAATVVATRRFARRQRSWFGRDHRIGWLPAEAPDLVDRAVDLVRAIPTRANRSG